MLMLRFANYFKGAVRIRISGVFPEKFINLCLARGIFLWGISRQNGDLLAFIRLPDFRRIRPLVKLSQSRIAVAGYSGLVVGTLLIEAIASALNAAGGRAGFMGPPEVEFKTAMIALTVLIISGLLASLMPAAKAASVNPIVALQDE